MWQPESGMPAQHLVHFEILSVLISSTQMLDRSSGCHLQGGYARHGIDMHIGETAVG